MTDRADEAPPRRGRLAVGPKHDLFDARPERRECSGQVTREQPAHEQEMEYPRLDRSYQAQGARQNGWPTPGSGRTAP